MHDQLEVAARHLVGRLKAGRPHVEAEKAKRKRFEAVYDGVEEWLPAEVASVRLTRPNGERRWKAGSSQRSAGGSLREDGP